MKKYSFFAAALFIIFNFVSYANAQGLPDGQAWWSSSLNNNSTNNMMNFGFGSFGGFGWIFMFVFWCLIVWVIIALIRGGLGRGHMCGHNHGDDVHGGDKSPLEILKERYAKSEIDKKEFEEKKKDLE